MMKHIIILYILLVNAYAEIYVKKVNVSCKNEKKCDELLDVKEIVTTYDDKSHLKSIMGELASISGVKLFSYEVRGNQLYIYADFESKIANIRFLYLKDDLNIEFNIPISEGDYLEKDKVELGSHIITETLKTMGYQSARVLGQYENNVLYFNIDVGEPLVIKSIVVSSESNFIEKYVRNLFSMYINKIYNKQEVRNQVTSLKELLVQYGYYLSEVTLNERNKKSKIEIFININKTDLFVLNTSNHSSQVALKKIFKNTVYGDKKYPTVDNLSSAFTKQFRSKGYLRNKIVFTKNSYKNILNDNVTEFKLKVGLGERFLIEGVEFRGISSKRGKLLESSLYDNASNVVSGGFVNEKYLFSFVDFIQKFYYELGYVNVLVTKPIFRFKNNKVKVIYKIREGLRAKVSSLKITGVTSEIKFLLLKSIGIKKDKPFNPIVFKQDLDVVQRVLLDKGFLYSRISNLESSDLISYKNSNSLVDIKLRVDLGEQYKIGNIFFVGKRDTRNKLIYRELGFSKGDYSSRRKLESARLNLLGLGIFSYVNIEKVPRKNGVVDIVVRTIEKDFGIIELAPGIRTDLGARFAFDLSYNNFDGMNKRINLKGAFNQRFNLKSLDEVRRVESNSLVEYDVALNYSENHIFNSDLNFITSYSTIRRRFFSFDADIQRVSYTFSKQLTSHLYGSFTQQFENISQFDASEEIHKGEFQIGSVTPAIRLDFRDSNIVTTKGALFNLSCEFANPTFLSQENDELTINYYKFVSRNKFYFPINNGVVAMSVALGVQENIAGSGSDESYIPSIKVFRLSGVDVVRGFEDEEINKVPGEIPIGDVRVDEKAYMGVIKIEPRFFMSDSTMLGIFYDAGRVSNDSIDLSNFRSSVGLSFKYITPVGSIDIDYGIKLLRKRLSSGKFETPGRLHVSIGFF